MGTSPVPVVTGCPQLLSHRSPGRTTERNGSTGNSTAGTQLGTPWDTAGDTSCCSPGCWELGTAVGSSSEGKPQLGTQLGTPPAAPLRAGHSHGHHFWAEGTGTAKPESTVTPAPGPCQDTTNTCQSSVLPVPHLEGKTLFICLQGLSET